MLFLFGYALTMDVESIPVLVVDGDKSEASRDLVSAFVSSGFFVVVEHAENADGVLSAFRQMRARGALVIPADFSRDLARGEAATAQLIVDGTDANVANIAMGYAAAIAQTRTVQLAMKTLAARGLSLGEKARPPINIHVRNWFNPALRSQWYLVPGLIAVIMAMLTVMLMALTVAREWERGTMEQLLVTPVHPVEIVIGKLVPYFAIGLMQIALVMSAGVLLFDVVPARGLGPGPAHLHRHAPATTRDAGGAPLVDAAGALALGLHVAHRLDAQGGAGHHHGAAGALLPGHLAQPLPQRDRHRGPVGAGGAAGPVRRAHGLRRRQALQDEARLTCRR
jgi:ABC-type Na+ efflux pump permease subunit